MPTNIIIPTDAFTESPNHDFIESPHHERDREAGIAFECTMTLRRSLAAGHVRNGYEAPLYISGSLTARTRLSAVFHRLTITSVRASDSDTQVRVYQMFYDHSADFFSDSNPTWTAGGTEDHLHETITSDTDTLVSATKESHDASHNLVATYTYVFDDAYTHAAFIADAEAIYSSKLAAWKASTTRTSEYWQYIAGTLTDGYDVRSNASILGLVQGGSGWYADVLTNVEVIGGEYYFYMPTVVTDLLCKNATTLQLFGSDCSTTGAINGDGFSTPPIAGTSGVTIATQIPIFDFDPYPFSTHEYHIRSFTGDPVTA